jgi:hypothetical protein
MIWLLAHPPPCPPSPVNKLSLIISLPVCRCSSLLKKRVVGGEGARSQIIQPRESLALYISFNTL